MTKDIDPTWAEADNTRCPTCYAPFEAVRPGKIQPTCPCEYIARLNAENDDLRDRIVREKRRADANEQERDAMRDSIHWVELQRLKNRVAYLFPFCTNFFTLEEALRRLVDAKDEKEANGDTPRYQELKKGVWEQAREVLTACSFLPGVPSRKHGAHPKDIPRVLRHRLQSEAFLCQDSHWPWGSWYEDRNGNRHAVERDAAAPKEAR